MKRDGIGRMQAVIDTEAGLDPALGVEHVCPFGEKAASEDEIGAALFSDDGSVLDGRLGWWRSIWAGHVAEGEFRARGSSGGMANWVACELLKRGHVDAVLHVRPRVDGGLFGFAVSRTLDELNSGAKSRYYPVEMSSVLEHVRENPGRYALVGIPCFIKGARLLALHDPVIAERLRFTIALVCGHLKTESFAHMFAWQLGIHPTRLNDIDFRVKNADGPANRYSVSVSGKNEHGMAIERTARNATFFGYRWSHGFFKYQACDYCDDVFGETADISVGDAWLPGWVDDSKGTNVVVTRSVLMDDIVKDAVAEGRLALRTISADDAAQSQDAGLRHRRQGLSVRLDHARRKGRWTPPKRVTPNSDLELRRRIVYRIREILSRRSHHVFQKALAAGDFNVFVRGMKRLMALHDFANNPRNLLPIARTLRKLVSIARNRPRS